MSIFKAATTTYIMNVSQLLGMSLLSMIVPLLIGMQNYGIFVTLFAMPGVLSGIVETVSVIHFSNRKFRSNQLPLFLSIGLGLSSLTFCVYWYFAGFEFGVAVFFLTLFMYCRSVLHGIYINSLGNVVRVSIMNELLVCLSYLFVVGAFYISGVSDFKLPLTMICLSSGVVTVNLYFRVSQNKVTHLKSVSDSTVSAKEVFRFSLSRFYEDFLFTFFPLVVGVFLGTEKAGEYRFLVSIMKAMSKMFPIRYEILIRDFSGGDHLFFKKMIKIQILFIVLSVPLWFGYYRYSPALFGLRSSLSLMLLCSGIIVFNIVFIPYIVKFRPIFSFYILLIMPFMILSIKYSGGEYFLFAFFILNLVVAILVHFYLKNILEESGVERS